MPRPNNPASTLKIRRAVYASPKTQATIAREAGVSDSLVHRWLTGMRKPGLDTTLPRLAAVLGVTTEDLIEL